MKMHHRSEVTAVGYSMADNAEEIYLRMEIPSDFDTESEAREYLRYSIRSKIYRVTVTIEEA